MAAFCVSCGNPLADGARFCNKCGATQPAAPAAPLQRQRSTPPLRLPPTGSSTAMKILIGILAFFMFLILAVAGSCVYIGYRVKQKAHEFSKSIGGCHALYRPAPAMRDVDHQRGRVRPGPAGRVRGTAGHHGLRIHLRFQRTALRRRLHMAGRRHHHGHRPRRHEACGGDGYLHNAGRYRRRSLPGSGELISHDAKGDVLVQIDLREAGISPDAAKNMARTIAGHL